MHATRARRLGRGRARVNLAWQIERWAHLSMREEKATVMMSPAVVMVVDSVPIARRMAASVEKPAWRSS